MTKLYNRWKGEEDKRKGDRVIKLGTLWMIVMITLSLQCSAKFNRNVLSVNANSINVRSRQWAVSLVIFSIVWLEQLQLTHHLCHIGTVITSTDCALDWCCAIECVHTQTMLRLVTHYTWQETETTIQTNTHRQILIARPNWGKPEIVTKLSTNCNFLDHLMCVSH